jgi:hypothetical protein
MDLIGISESEWTTLGSFFCRFFPRLPLFFRLILFNEAGEILAPKNEKFSRAFSAPATPKNESKYVNKYHIFCFCCKYVNKYVSIFFCFCYKYVNKYHIFLFLLQICKQISHFLFSVANSGHFNEEMRIVIYCTYESAIFTIITFFKSINRTGYMDFWVFYVAFMQLKIFLNFNCTVW